MASTQLDLAPSQQRLSRLDQKKLSSDLRSLTKKATGLLSQMNTQLQRLREKNQRAADEAVTIRVQLGGAADAAPPAGAALPAPAAAALPRHAQAQLAAEVAGQQQLLLQLQACQAQAAAAIGTPGWSASEAAAQFKLAEELLAATASAHAAPEAASPPAGQEQPAGGASGGAGAPPSSMHPPDSDSGGAAVQAGAGVADGAPVDQRQDGSAAAEAGGASGGEGDAEAGVVISKGAAWLSPYIQREVVQNGFGLPGNPPVRLPKQVTPTAWDMVLEYCSYHAVPGRSDKERRVFDERFVRRDSAQLCDLTSAADGLEMRGLVDLASRAIARLIEGKSAEQIREAFRLPDDLSEEEKLEPLAAPLAGGADPRMRMLNRLYAKRRKELQTRRQQLDAARGAAAAHPLLLDGAGEQAQRAEQQQAQDDRSLDDLLDFIESSGGSAASAATGGNSSKASGGGKAKKKKKGKQAAQQPATGDGVAGGEQQQAQQQQRQEAAVPATAVERRDGAPPPAVQQEQQERQQKQRHQPPEEAQQQEQQQQPAAGERGDAAGAQVQAQAPLDAEVSQQLALSNAWLSQAGLGVGPLATALPPAIARYLVPPRPLGGELDAAGAPGLLQPRALGGLEAPSAAAGAADLLPAGSAAASDGHRATARAALTYRPVTVLTSLANFRGATHVQRVCPQPNPSGKGKPALPPPASGENGRDATGSASSSTSGSSGGRSSGTASPARKLPHASEPEAAAMNGLTAEVAAVVDAMQAANAEGAGQPAAAAPALGAASADAGSGGATAEQTASLPTLDEQQQQQHAAVTLQQSEPAPLPQQQERQLLLAAGDVEAVAGLLSSFLRQLGLHQALQVIAAADAGAMPSPAAPVDDASAAATLPCGARLQLRWEVPKDG